MKKGAASAATAKQGGLVRSLLRRSPSEIKLRDHVSPHAADPHLHRGYRDDFTFLDCVASLFRLHNETFNIWTHLLACVVLFTYGRTALDTLPLGAGLRATFVVFEVCILCCFGFSTIFHTFCAMSSSWYHRLLRLDFVGISLVIGGSYFPPLFFCFQPCQPTEGTVYLVTVAVLTVAAALIIVAPPGDKHSEYRTVRVALFVSLGLFGLIPVAHGYYLHGFHHPVMNGFALRILCMYLLFGTAVLFYTTRFPERFFPHVFDVLGHSHQWFHVFSFLGIFFHFRTCLMYAQEDWGTVCASA